MIRRNGFLLTGLFLVSIATTACAGFSEFVDSQIAYSKTKYKSSSSAKPGSGDAKSLVTIDQMLSITSKKKANGQAYGFIRAPRELWAPFRWEVRAGALDPDGASVGPGFFCTELDGKDTDPLEYYGICAQPTGGGLNVFVIRKGNSNVASQFFAGTDTIEFAVEADGEDMIFQARIPGGGWTTVATIGFSSQSFGLLPSVGAAQMPSSTEVDFDFFRVLWNGARPGASGGEIAGEAAWKVVDAVLEAGYALDGGFNNLGAADEAYSDAADAVVAAQALADGITDAKDKKAFIKSLGKVEKGITKVRAKIEKGTSAKTALNAVKGLAKNATKAAMAAFDY